MDSLSKYDDVAKEMDGNDPLSRASYPPEKGDPLFVCGLTDTHYIRLNRFPIYENHVKLFIRYSL